MNIQRVAGMVLLVIGFVALLAGGFSWTRTKTVLDVGPLKATTQERKTIPVSPVLGVIAVIGGIVLLAVPSKRRA
jgi:uncharacterized membrane protein YidH (DUF202 family)